MGAVTRRDGAGKLPLLHLFFTSFSPLSPHGMEESDGDETVSVIDEYEVQWKSGSEMSYLKMSIDDYRTRLTVMESMKKAESEAFRAALQEEREKLAKAISDMKQQFSDEVAKSKLRIDEIVAEMKQEMSELKSSTEVDANKKRAAEEDELRTSSRRRKSPRRFSEKGAFA